MMTLDSVVTATDGRRIGPDVVLRGISIDSRRLAPGELYVAIIGQHLDGHRFAAAARDAGAAALLVSQPLADLSLPQVVVNDTTRALGRIAAAWRKRFTMPLIGVTGSNGKTTVKEMIAAICRQKEDGLVSERNLNNEIGLPLNLLRLRATHRWAVVEMGMNHPGEIAWLTRLARPDVALVNNAAAAHLEGLGNVAAVAEAKAEIFEGLGAQGIAVINADDDYCDLWRQRATGKQVVRFGFDSRADVRVEADCRFQDSDIRLTWPDGSVEVKLKMPGKHNAGNAAAAAAAALAIGMEAEHIRAGLSALTPVEGRLQILRTADGDMLIDDSYNANPDSLQAALEVLVRGAGEKILVLGDMAELGAGSEAFHQQAGELARKLGVDVLLGIGEFSAAACEAFGKRAQHFADRETLLEQLSGDRPGGRSILVKGSRSMGMEWFVERLSEGPFDPLTGSPDATPRQARGGSH